MGAYDSSYSSGFDRLTCDSAGAFGSAFSGAFDSESCSDEFEVPVNNASSVVAIAYTAGSGSLTVEDASSFGNLFPIRISTFRNDEPLSIIKCTNITGNVLTIAGTWGSYPDADLQVGDDVECTVTAETIQTLIDAILDLRSRVGG